MLDGTVQLIVSHGFLPGFKRSSKETECGGGKELLRKGERAIPGCTQLAEAGRSRARPEDLQRVGCVVKVGGEGRHSQAAFGGRAVWCKGLGEDISLTPTICLTLQWASIYCFSAHGS